MNHILHSEELAPYYADYVRRVLLAMHDNFGETAVRCSYIAYHTKCRNAYSSASFHGEGGPRLS